MTELYQKQKILGLVTGGIRVDHRKEQQAEKELEEIRQWWIEEEKKAIDQLKASGKYRGGLDGHYEELVRISKEANRRIRELQLKYYGKTNFSEESI